MTVVLISDFVNKNRVYRKYGTCRRVPRAVASCLAREVVDSMFSEGTSESLLYFVGFDHVH